MFSDEARISEKQAAPKEKLKNIKPNPSDLKKVIPDGNMEKLEEIKNNIVRKYVEM